LGVDNLITLLDDSALQAKAKACIIDGRTLKSENQWFNKRLAALQSQLPFGRKTSHQIRRLFAKRNRWMKDFMHKVSRLVADYCYENDITEVVIGYNEGWKQEVDMGGAGNQRFVQIPYLTLIQMLEYKLFDYGIRATRHEESYTSKTDHFAMEPMCHIEPEKRLGQRVHRGLFRSSTGAVINADVNGAIGTGRKSKGERWIARFMIANSGVAPTPVRIGIWPNPSAQSRNGSRATNKQACLATAL
jgi:putative transposase